MNKLKILAILLLLFPTFFIGFKAFDLYLGQNIMKTTGVFADAGLEIYSYPGSEPLTSIDWGIVYPDTNVTKDIFVVNVGNVQTFLKLNTADWEPAEAETCLQISWNYDNHTLQPLDNVSMTLTLHVAPDPGEVTDFSFNIIISNIEKEEIIIPPPPVQIISPVEGDVIQGATTIQALILDKEDLSFVMFYVDKQFVGWIDNPTLNASYGYYIAFWYWDTTYFSNGDHSVHVKVSYQHPARSIYSDPIWVKVENTHKGEADL